MPFVPLGQSVPPEMRSRVAPLRALNSSVVVSSRALLRDGDHYDAYLERLSPDARKELDATPTVTAACSATTLVYTLAWGR